MKALKNYAISLSVIVLSSLLAYAAAIIIKTTFMIIGVMV